MSLSPPSRSTGFTDTQLGMILFIAAETMFFGALASSYVFLRTAAETPWPLGRAVLPVAIATGTIFLLMAVAFALSEARRHAGNLAKRNGALRWLCIASGVAVAASIMVVLELLRLRALGHTPASSNLIAIYLLCTGMIAVRALAVAAVASLAALRLPRDRPAPGRIEGLAYYAQFLAVLSMVQFVLFYLV